MVLGGHHRGSSGGRSSNTPSHQQLMKEMKDLKDMKECDVKEEPDFIETHCHWIGCDRDFGTQDQLVKVS
jgi:hypothetical protein